MGLSWIQHHLNFFNFNLIRSQYNRVGFIAKALKLLFDNFFDRVSVRTYTLKIVKSRF